MSNGIVVRKSRIRKEVTDKAVHQAAWGNAKCNACGGPPVIHLRSSMLLKELMTEKRAMFDALGMLTGGKLPTFETTYGTMVCVAEAYACARCRKEAEVQAAKGPSNALVEIFQRVPNSWTSKTVQVPVGAVAKSVSP